LVILIIMTIAVSMPLFQRSCRKGRENLERLGLLFIHPDTPPMKKASTFAIEAKNWLVDTSPIFFPSRV